MGTDMAVTDDTQKVETDVILACAIARDLESFELLIEDLENRLGAGWGGLDFNNAEDILRSSHADALQFITIALDKTDEDNLSSVDSILRVAKERGIKVILVTHDLTPMSLHHLMRLGADDFVPYPLPKGALDEAIDRLLAEETPKIIIEEKIVIKEVFVPAPSADNVTQMPVATSTKQGIMLAVYGMAGGVGATTFATNLAWELQQLGKASNKSICILDFDFQFGSVATYLDVPKTEAAFEMMTDPGNADVVAFKQVLSKYNDTLAVLPSPQDAVPLEFVGAEEIEQVISLAKRSYDIVIIDLPRTLVSWSEIILNECELFLSLIGLDMRSAQNIQRFLQALKADDLPFEKVQFVLNRAPKMTDLNGKSRVKRMTESLSIDLRWQLSDGGKAVSAAGDHGVPLAEMAQKNVLRKEISKIAETILELTENEFKAAAE